MVTFLRNTEITAGLLLFDLLVITAGELIAVVVVPYGEHTCFRIHSSRVGGVWANMTSFAGFSSIVCNK